jgi:hypothetical protein
MSRREDLERFYALLESLRSRLGGPHLLMSCHGRLGWPKRGVYFFFEDGETRPGSLAARVVRVGTHAVSTGSKTKLWHRLRQHRGSGSKDGSPGAGNHRGSIFRHHVGDALLRAGRSPVDIKSTWSAKEVARHDVKALEEPLEQLVSETIGRMPFLWVEADDEPGPLSIRSVLERNSIGLLSGAESPSPGWLGHHASSQHVRQSGLWNIGYTGHVYEPGFLELLGQRILATSSR